MFRFRRALGHVLLALSFVSASLVAPEHVHEAEPGHHGTVVHRHLEAHGHDGVSLDDADGRVVWLADVAIQTNTPHFSQPPAVLVGLFQFGALQNTFTPARTDIPAPDHGPPRSQLSLRAPPSPSI